MHTICTTPHTHTICNTNMHTHKDAETDRQLLPTPKHTYKHHMVSIVTSTHKHSSLYWLSVEPTRTTLREHKKQQLTLLRTHLHTHTHTHTQSHTHTLTHTHTHSHTPRQTNT